MADGGAVGPDSDQAVIGPRVTRRLRFFLLPCLELFQSCRQFRR